MDLVRTGGRYMVAGQTSKGKIEFQPSLAKGTLYFLRNHGVDLAVGYDGYLYCRTGTGYSGPLERYDRALKPVPTTS